MRSYLVIGCFLLLALPAIHGTGLPDQIPASLNEKIEVMTDRHLYAVGEKILFAGIRLCPSGLDSACWSRVLYLELLTPGGSSVAQGKFPLYGSGASGHLSIPENLLTGNYYLVAYTKWMRNFSPMNFCYRSLKIFNPFTAQLEASSPGNGTGQTEDREEKSLREVIRCHTERSVYGQREKVRLSISIPASARSLTGTYTVSVVRKNVTLTQNTPEIRPAEVLHHNPPGTLFLPESRGLSLSGRLVPADSATRVGHAAVQLALLGQEPEFRVATTGSDGSFIFALDSMTGRNDMYITSPFKGPPLEIRIDNDFANPSVRFPEIPFILSEAEKKGAGEIIFNSQINSHFPSRDTGNPGSEEARERAAEDGPIKAFYGLPSRSVLIDDYIELPTLKEVLIELIPGVTPRVRNRVPYLIFSGNKLSFTLINQYTPLLLVDHVPVFDLEKLLLMSPKKIERVEILNEIYIIGHHTYGGILNIITRKGDLAGIDLPEHAYFFDFTSFLPQDGPVFPSHSSQEFDSENPDYRNCLYWSAGIPVLPGEETGLDFYTADNSGEYTAIIRGFAEDGTLLLGTCDFRVE